MFSSRLFVDVLPIFRGEADLKKLRFGHRLTVLHCVTE